MRNSCKTIKLKNVCYKEYKKGGALMKEKLYLKVYGLSTLTIIFCLIKVAYTNL